MKRFFLLTALIVYLTPALGLAREQVYQAYDPQTDTIQIHYFESVPWYYKSKDGNYKGISVEIWDKLFALAGLNYKVEVVPFARMLLYLKLGKSYGQGLFIGKEMKEYGIIPEPAGYMNICVYGKKGTNFKTLEDLRGKTVGVVRNSAPLRNWNQIDWFEKWAVENDEQGVLMLKAGRLDALAGGEVAIRFLIKKLGFQESDFGASFILVRTPWTFLISKKANVPEVTRRIEKAIATFREQDYTDKSINAFLDRVTPENF